MEENKKYFFDHFLVVMILGVALSFIGGLIGIPLEYIGTKVADSTPDLYAVCLYGSTIGCWIAVLLFMVLFKPDRPLIKAIFCGKGNTLRLFLIGIVLGFAANGSCILVSALRRDISLYYDPSGLFFLIAGFIAVLIQSGSEELVCRHLMQQHLRRRYGKPWLEILLPALTFAALHLANPGISVLAVANLLVCGIMMGSFVYYFDSLWLAIGVHTMWNFTQNMIFGLPNSGIVLPLSIFRLDAASATDSFSYNVDFGVEGSLMTLLVQLIIIGFVIVLGRKKKAKEMPAALHEQGSAEPQ